MAMTNAKKANHYSLYFFYIKEKKGKTHLPCKSTPNEAPISLLAVHSLKKIVRERETMASFSASRPDTVLRLKIKKGKKDDAGTNNKSRG
jgi:hypothetical protein